MHLRQPLAFCFPLASAPRCSSHTQPPPPGCHPQLSLPWARGPCIQPQAGHLVCAHSSYHDLLSLTQRFTPLEPSPRLLPSALFRSQEPGLVASSLPCSPPVTNLSALMAQRPTKSSCHGVSRPGSQPLMCQPGRGPPPIAKSADTMTSDFPASGTVRGSCLSDTATLRCDTLF